MDELYYSNNGRGPYVARIVESDANNVWLELKRGENVGRWQRPIMLTRTAFKRSGWRMRDSANAAESEAR